MFLVPLFFYNSIIEGKVINGKSIIGLLLKRYRKNRARKIYLNQPKRISRLASHEKRTVDYLHKKLFARIYDRLPEEQRTKVLSSNETMQSHTLIRTMQFPTENFKTGMERSSPEPSTELTKNIFFDFGHLTLYEIFKDDKLLTLRNILDQPLSHVP